MGGNVIAVLMPALARLSRTLEKEHRLQSQHVGTDENFQYVQYVRVSRNRSCNSSRRCSMWSRRKYSAFSSGDK